MLFKNDFSNDIVFLDVFFSDKIPDVSACIIVFILVLGPHLQDD